MPIYVYTKEPCVFMYLVERWVLKEETTLLAFTSLTHHRTHKIGTCGTEAARWTILIKVNRWWYLVLWAQFSWYLRLWLTWSRDQISLLVLVGGVSYHGFLWLISAGRIRDFCWEECVSVVQSVCSSAHLSGCSTFQTRRPKIQDSHLSRPNSISTMDLEWPSIAMSRI